MKMELPCFLLVLLITAAKADDVITLRGEKFTGVTVTRTEPDGIVIMHAAGIVKIPFSELAPDLQAKYHYDPKAAASYAAQVAANQAAIYRNAQAAKLAHVAEVDAGLRHSAAENGRRDIGKQLIAKTGYRLYTLNHTGVALEYHSRDELAAGKVNEGKNLLLTPDQIAKSMAELPAGGRLTFKIERNTIGAADTQWFTAIIVDSRGKEIVRQAGANRTAQLPITEDIWWNLFIVDLAAEIDPSVDVFLADQLTNTRAHFRITTR